MICAAAITYDMKYESQELSKDLRRIQGEVEVEENMIHLLRADWAFLTEPVRINFLVTQYQKQLGLQLIQPWQIVKVSDIPDRLSETVQNIIVKTPFKFPTPGSLDQNVEHR
jgi:hypothetical protein